MNNLIVINDCREIDNNISTGLCNFIIGRVSLTKLDKKSLGNILRISLNRLSKCNRQ